MNAFEVKCSCQHCSEHIAFESQYAGRMTTCPHCGMETMLFVPNKAPSRAARDRATVGVARGTIACSYVLCFLIPIAGFFAGLYLVLKKEVGHGIACMGISVVFGSLFIIMLAAG